MQERHDDIAKKGVLIALVVFPGGLLKRTPKISTKEKVIQL